MNERMRTKLLSSILFLTITLGVYVYSYRTSFYPVINTYLMITLVLIFSIAYAYSQNWDSLRYILLPLVGVSVAYRLIIFTSPASVPGVDPQKHLLQAAKVARSGTIDSINLSPFYERAPNYFIYLAEAIIVLDISAPKSLVTILLLSGVLLPILAYAITKRITPRRPALSGVTAALLIASGCWSLKFSYMPIPQTLALMLFSCWILLMSRDKLFESRRATVVGVFLLGASGLVHKLFLTLSVGGMMGIAILLLASRISPTLKARYDASINSRNFLIYGILVMTLALTQWLFITQYIEYIIIDVVVTILKKASASPWDLVFSPGSFSTYQPTAAAKPDTRLFSISGARARGTYMFIFIGFISFIILYLKAYSRFLITLAVHGFVVGIAVFGLLGPSTLELRRLFYVLELVYAVQISTALWSVDSAVLKRVLVAGVVLIITLQAISAPAVPDYQNSPRYYLTSDEVAGKNFAYKHTDDTVATDPYLQNAVTDTKRRIAGSTRFTILRQALTEQKLMAQNLSFVLFRTKVNTYWFGKLGNWELTWDVEPRLNQKYNKVYTSGGTGLYSR